MAYALRRQENYAAAADLLVRAIALSPQDPALFIHAAETLGIVGRYDEALAYIRKALVLGPDQTWSTRPAVGWRSWPAGPAEARSLISNIPPTENTEVLNYLFRIEMELRDYPAAPAVAKRLPTVEEAQYRTVSRDMAMDRLHGVLGQDDLARADFTRAEAEVGALAATKPDAGILVAAHAVALAGMGQSEEALAEIARSMTMYPASKDPWIQTWRLYDLVIIQMLAGQTDTAVQTLGRLIERQTDVISPALLQSTPDLDPLRGRDDFKALLAKVSQAE